MDYISQIRVLARSSYYQNIFSTAKEVGSINIFDNEINYSGLQSLFLYWLQVYDMLYNELSQQEWKYLDEKVIEDDSRTDAFLYWRVQQRSQEIDKYKQKQKEDNFKFKKPGKISTFDVDFSG